MDQAWSTLISIKLEQKDRWPFNRCGDPFTTCPRKNLQYSGRSLAKSWTRHSSEWAVPQQRVPSSLAGSQEEASAFALATEDWYPLPLIHETLNQIGKARWYTKLDVSTAFHKIRIPKEQEWMTGFRTRYGLYKWLVTLFRLVNEWTPHAASRSTLTGSYGSTWISSVLPL